MKLNQNIKLLLIITVITSFLVGCSAETNKEEDTSNPSISTSNKDESTDQTSDTQKEEDKEEDTQTNTEYNDLGFVIDNNNLVFNDKSYKIIEVDGGNRSGNRQSNVAVNIGFGDREYWAITNDYGQLVNVFAKDIVLQDDDTEPVNSSGRYYDDEANVPGTEHKDLDQGHIIADSLGGVANAYNITPQDSTLNRHGDQAYMEKAIRDARGCTDFRATITYPNKDTQTPSEYKYEYVLKGNKIVDEFSNKDPEQGNTTTQAPDNNTQNQANDKNEDLASVDTNGNGKVTIKEAKAAGYKMPIGRDHWLYKYMSDGDGDGFVGE